ncbi:restriction endonuclease subunit S [Pseudomonas lundensis]|uniref:restriction endonuclease subunit S n=1 Tax=Serratia proteamaculans TaxID=28151 RepID=UPI0029816804|nr:restriction endonuclease subunit S [Serratia proteamaculans]MDW5501075.1 restriction endonuclease subunit S [Serratia proteamaculans]MDW5506139.1 restriction endonuclease subunit S [Pseudomonas lundensis]
MSSKLRKVKLKDISSFKYGKTIRKQDIESSGDYPVFSGYQIVGYLPNYMYKEEQLIIVCRGAGGTGDIKMSPNLCSITNLAIIISCDDSVIDKGYLYWRLILSDTYSLRTGSAQPQITINTLESFEIEIEPNLRKQREIATTLFSINNKIKKNAEINQTLEQMAQALFKSWLVDFEPVKAKIAVLKAGGSQKEATLAAMTAISGKDADSLAIFEREHSEKYAELKATSELFPCAMQESELGTIPAGWESSSLAQKIKLIGGGTPKRSEPSYWGGDICWYSVKDAPNDSNIFVIDTIEKITIEGLKKSSTKLLPAGTTIISARGTVGKLALAGVETAMNQSCYGISGENYSGPYLTYLKVNKCIDALKRNTHGAVFDTITTNTFDTVNVVTASKKINNEFEKLITPLFNVIKSNLISNSYLTQLRDTLLPKLLSGEISLPEAEQTVNEATHV